MTMSVDNFDQHLLVDKVSIAYGQHTIVQDVSLAVAEGEIGCLLGPSGCGKSTLLRAIAGFVPLKSGSISLASKTLAKDGFCLPAESRNVGMVFQDVALFPHINIAANVALHAATRIRHPSGVRSQEARDLPNSEASAQRSVPFHVRCGTTEPLIQCACSTQLWGNCTTRGVT